MLQDLLAQQRRRAAHRVGAEDGAAARERAAPEREQLGIAQPNVHPSEIDPERLGADLRIGGELALSLRGHARQHGDVAGGVDAHERGLEIDEAARPRCRRPSPQAQRSPRAVTCRLSS